MTISRLKHDIACKVRPCLDQIIFQVVYDIGALERRIFANGYGKCKPAGIAFGTSTWQVEELFVGLIDIKQQLIIATTQLMYLWQFVQLLQSHSTL